MREIRLSGSEGGEAEINRPSLPLSVCGRGGFIRFLLLSHVNKCTVFGRGCQQEFLGQIAERMKVE